MTTANASLSARTATIAVGDKAPDFTLPDQDRNDVSLSALLAKGGDVVLSFFPLAFTGVCTTEMECFTSDIARFADKNTTVVGISCDSFATQKAFADASKIEIPLPGRHAPRGLQGLRPLLGRLERREPGHSRHRFRWRREMGQRPRTGGCD